MAITIVVGGQYGGEGKGKVTYNIAQEKNIKITVRVGGTNSGHTVVTNENQKFILRQLPTTAILSDSLSILSAGSYIDLDILKEEIKLTGISDKQLLIDQNAMIITQEDKNNEEKNNLRKTIGSTLSGTGESVIRRITRNKMTLLAKDIDELKPYIIDSKSFYMNKFKKNKKYLLKGHKDMGYLYYIVHIIHIVPHEILQQQDF